MRASPARLPLEHGSPQNPLVPFGPRALVGTPGVFEILALCPEHRLRRIRLFVKEPSVIVFGRRQLLVSVIEPDRGLARRIEIDPPLQRLRFRFFYRKSEE